MRGFDREQAELLCERYWDIWLGEPGTLALLLAQAPIIAGFIVTAWRDAKETPTLHLFLCLAALWIGCMNACREIVKELAMFKRERHVGLGVLPYAFSKMWVLGILDLVACVTLVAMVNYWVGLAGSKLLLAGVLWLTALAGTALGLAISALCASSDRAVGMVPLVVLPQILFTRAFLPDGHAGALSRTLENVTLLGWSYDLYGVVRTVGSEPRLSALAKDALALGGLGAALVLVTLVMLAAED